MDVERWLDAVQEMLSRDATGLGDRENLQAELNKCKVRCCIVIVKTLRLNDLKVFVAVNLGHFKV